MKALIEKTSPLYLKRLARELNSLSLSGGFYVNADAKTVRRCHRARIKAGSLEVHSYSSAEWFAPANHEFSDAYGRAIVASRQA